MSIYNRAQYVDEAVRSVLADGSAVHELLMVDDGSTDGADAVAAAYADRAVFLRQDHRGCAAAWNLGLQHARGAYVTFCDSDDVWMPRHTGPLRAVLDARRDVDAAVGVTTEFVSPELDTESLGARAPYDLSQAPVGGAMLIRRAVFDAVGAFDPDLRQGYWFDWYRRFADAGVRMIQIDDVVLRRRIHNANSSILQGEMLGEYARALHASILRRRARQ
jgi:glycosyltransferase involved in cell wall biosynthesis